MSEPIDVPTPPPVARPKPLPNPYKGVFYDNDFSHLESPGAQRYLGDALKRRSLGCCITINNHRSKKKRRIRRVQLARRIMDLLRCGWMGEQPRGAAADFDLFERNPVLPQRVKNIAW